jgi:transcriptional regulator with XRE-family HTH domain
MPTEDPASPQAAPPAPAPAPAPTPSATPAVAKVTPGSKAWAEMSTEQRHAQLRGPENPRARGHSPARDQREAAAAQKAGTTPEQRVEAPDGELPANTEKVKIGKFEVSEAELAAMMTRHADDDLRRATVPASPEKYLAQLPENLTLPGSQTYKFDESDPSLVAARNLAHSKGWSQQDFSEALGIFASHIAGQEAALAERSRAEIAKAGTNAPQRVDAIGKWIRGEVGDVDAKPILATIVTDAHLRFYERLQQRITSQGAASFSQSHRVPPDNKSIPGYEGMTFEQRRFAQDQRAQQRR